VVSSAQVFGFHGTFCIMGGDDGLCSALQDLMKKFELLKNSRSI